jgi:uroporphyrinogen III methyltransferase/synthase
VPEEFRAEALAESLAHTAAGQRLLLVRASRGREVLAEQLRAAGGDVEQVIAYQSTDVLTPHEEVAARLAAGRIDCVTVTSSAIARSLVAMFGANLHHTRLASISPITTATLQKLGFQPTFEAHEYTMQGIVNSLRETTW